MDPIPVRIALHRRGFGVPVLAMRRTFLALGAAVAALAIASPAAQAATCPEQPLTQPFAPWYDYSQYALAPDGGFEAGAAGWTLAGGAAVVDGNEPYLDGARSLALPAGATATTPPVCVTVAHPTIRFFARNDGTPLSLLVVTAHFSVLGIPLSLPVGVVAGGEAWAPSPILLIVGNLLSDEVSFSFQAVTGSWQVDDLYVDPYSKG